MSLDRQTKVAEQVAYYVALFVQKEANSDPLITITRATVSSDYSNATIFFTTIPDNRQNDASIFLKRSGSEMRHFIKKKMRIKQIPFLTFEVDYGERHRQHIDEIVRETGTEPTFEVPK
jgi:ribosome-binding factor A